MLGGGVGGKYTSITILPTRAGTSNEILGGSLILKTLWEHESAPRDEV